MQQEKIDCSLLIIDDDADVLTSAELFLEENFTTVRTASDPRYILPMIKKQEIDMVLLDMNFRKGQMDGHEGLFWMDKIKAQNPEIIVILMTAFGDIELAVNGIKKGAFDFVLKPWKNAKLLATLISASRYKQSQQESIKFKEQSRTLNQDLNKNFSEIVGESPAVIQLKETLRKVAETDANVLLLGENGTGKELAARELHRLSPRNSEAFITVDMGAITETLFESEIFGHSRGAFTDAKSDKAGRFEIAHQGTIFLDEIGNLSYSLQAKLLTVIQNRKVARVGSTKEIPVDVRLICATNMPLKQMIEEGKFRQDLFYRINTFEINIPPLRERKEDIPLLAEYFLKHFKQKYHKPTLTFPPKSITHLKNYHWPGNIRELKNIIERLVVLSDGKQLIIDPGLFSSFEKNTEKIKNNLNLEENEKHIILKALEKHKGNISKASRELGIQRNALYRRLEKYGL
ncbi:MAG: sigma-54 dependent transcriptional regulator [Bacteroidales bacterium]|nr:sigma-54 dependent transcriptional regulator [Bacteroidales bacterium]